MPGPDLTPDEQIIFNEFRVSIGRVFQPLYDNWDDDKWDKAVAEFNAKHPVEMTSKVLAVLGWESGWEDARAHFKKGPPPFMRPGWVSPLVGQKVDLSILDNPSDVEWIKGDASGRNEVRVVIVEFWAAWCAPCLKVFPHMSKLAADHNDKIKVIGINVENIFGEQPKVDIREWVAGRDDMNYNIGIDLTRKTIDVFMKPGGRQGIPTAFVITPIDSTVHFVGDPEGIDEVLVKLL